MEKICGYKGKNGNFYKKERDCYIADLQFEIEQTERKLSNFWVSLDDYIFIVDHGYEISTENLREIFCKMILRHSDDFVEIINQKKELAETLDKLRKEKEFQSKWWVKYKWW